MEFDNTLQTLANFARYLSFATVLCRAWWFSVYWSIQRSKSSLPLRTCHNSQCWFGSRSELISLRTWHQWVRIRMDPWFQTLDFDHAVWKSQRVRTFFRTELMSAARQILSCDCPPANDLSRTDLGSLWWIHMDSSLFWIAWILSHMFLDWKIRDPGIDSEMWWNVVN